MGGDIKTENSLLGIKTESPGLRREEADKRRSSDKGGSTAEKKARSGKSGLFSPSPPHDSKHDLQFPSLISPLKQEPDQKRNRTTSSSSNNDAIVNVQKLENKVNNLAKSVHDLFVQFDHLSQRVEVPG